MKKIRKSLIACVAALSLGGLTGCELFDKTVHVETVTVSEPNVSMRVGDEKTITVNVAPEGADKGVSFTSSAESVATVSAEGKITAVGEGTAVITVTSNDGGKTATITVVVGKARLYPSLPIVRSEAYETYLKNIKPNDVNKNAEFADRTQVYEVGNDNKVNFRPVFTVTDADDNELPQSAWYEPFTISVLKKSGNEYVAAPSSEYEIVDALQCDVEFADTTSGIYKVKVELGGLSAEEKAQLEDLSLITAEYDVNVVDGYNVTSEFELAYLDTTVANETRCDWGSGNDEFTPNLPAFKAAHGLTAQQPKALIFHKDMHLAKEYLPEEYFVREADMANWDASEKTRSAGSFKDWVYLYNKVDEEKIAISGNYFTLDWSKIPLITRPWGDKLGEGEKVESHGGFFRSYGGELEVRNLNIIGNAHAAKTQEDVKLAGGMIGFKAQGSTTKSVIKNVLGHGCYITFFNNIGDNSVPLLDVSSTKLFDNYHTFIYNWGSEVYVEDSIFEGCGGPVLMQDHTGVDAKNGAPHDTFEGVSETGYKFEVLGNAPKATFVDCEFNNYLVGTEAWFQSFNATTAATNIKMLGDGIRVASGETRSMVFDENHEPAYYAAQAAQQKDALFNFIVINKSGSTEGMTAYPVNGSVEFLHKAENSLDVVDSFNYLNPPVVNDEHPLDLANIPAAIDYQKFRELQQGGAPVIETASGVAYNVGGEAFYDLAKTAPSDILSNPTPIDATFMGGAKEYVTIYFNGMGLVFALNK